jgi:eukaryotic-like serine/threonine-protein kinase
MSVRESAPKLPAAIGRYEVRELLGEGAFGAVYRAFDPHLEREVALKVLRSEWMTSPQAVERFLREAKAAARLLHPHIVPVHDAGRAGDLYYIASAFIRGKTLAAAVPAEGMAPRRAAELAAQLASALGYAHRQGVVHRDVKPQNILLDEQGSLHLTDFGLACWVQEWSTRLTQEGVVVGTPAYMSPEQASGDTASVGPASDLYSTGVVLYALLTARLPFEATNRAALMYKIVHTAAPPPSRFRPGLDAGLEAICLKALAKRPKERFGSGEEMAAALAAWAAAAPSPKTEAACSPEAPHRWDQETVDHRPGRQAHATQSTASAAPAKGRWARAPLRWALAGGAALVLLTGLALAGVAAFFHPGPAPSAGKEPADPREPARAVAPFDEAEAKRFQQAWADYLGFPVVREVDLGGGATMRLILIPPGTFQMGSPESDPNAGDEEMPRHKVTITKPYYLGASPVTRGQFTAFVEAERYKTEAETDGSGAGYSAATRDLDAGPRYSWRDPGFAQTDEEPAVNLTWYDAMNFCEWLSTREKKAYGLPTEAQWEYACRAGTTTRFWCGDADESLEGNANILDASARATFRAGLNKVWAFQSWDDGHPFTSPVGAFKANPWGLYDMHGNVWQWCGDYYDGGYYGQSPVNDPQNLSETEARVLRGGSWFRDPSTCRAAQRSGIAPDCPRSVYGCRVCLPLN